RRRTRKEQRRSLHVPTRITEPDFVQQKWRKCVLIVPYHRLRQRILRASGQRVCGDRAAAICKRGDRRREILEIRIAAENLIAAGKAVIQSYVELVLIVRFIVNASVIVGLCS